uniref:Uncharacterized protein n=1 Tax=Chromera velia CCMP2878 TaxID=1169474 RepID=A0A0G4HYC0_9ALVE|eukprot:Cvel_9448.t1-p1 / transcript=Cvel_9448.t1 / gene=Cvel_9448 / organism=Chromera_velia_CCMP2878 / gene_product=hypothetical protein / transcript_product=hypothetical protein / location=Cvel_scaffold545:22863-24701(-) / protein_length=424 / sequence_SO=supercontig / SO=protein_coding / is_pseudo=false
MSTFGPLEGGTVQVARDVSRYFGMNATSSISEIEMKKVTGGFKWPNAVRTVPEDFFGSKAFLVPDGFLVPLHKSGGLFLVFVDDDLQETAKCTISAKSGFFHHKGIWIDIDLDGLPDLLTSRSDAKAGDGELLWLKNPGGVSASQCGEWEERVITKGPDVLFAVLGDDGFEGKSKRSPALHTAEEEEEEEDTPESHRLTVFASEFFNKRLVRYSINRPEGTVEDSLVIDDTLDKVYSVTPVDLNVDGWMDLLVNNHQMDSDSTKGMVVAYEALDKDGKAFKRHTLLEGFENKKSKSIIPVPNMSPGFPVPVWPRKVQQGHEPPHVLIAGDGDFTLHLLRPKTVTATGGGVAGTSSSSFSFSFEYEHEKVLEADGTIAFAVPFDLDGDGWTEVVAPNYDTGKVEVFGFTDAKGEELGAVSELIVA